MGHTSTHTHALLEVSEVTFKEVRDKLAAAGYGDQISLDVGGRRVTVDMSGLALVEHPGFCPEPGEYLGRDVEGKPRPRPCGATLVRCDDCGRKWCVRHQVNPFACPGCGRRP